MFSVRSKQTSCLYTRDRVRLDADVYYPDSDAEFPVLLMRQPYGRSIASTVVYAHPSWYAAHGYIVVIQDVRGRGTSEGIFDLFAHEREDGEDTIAWAANLPQSNGQVGMYGFSYQGMTQLYAAAAQPPALKTICPAMTAYDLYQDWAYEGGAFCYQMNLSWAIQLAAETARRQNNVETYHTLYAASRNPSLSDPVCARSGILRRLAPDSHYHTWLDRADASDPYWRHLSPSLLLHNTDLPMLHIGGWFDTYLRGTLKLYNHMASRSQFPQHLVVGPWAHLPWGRRVGAIDYGPEANSPIDRLQLRWFDQVLKGIDTGLLNEAPVCLFEMGTNQWRQFDRFPPDHPETFYFLQTTGLASLDDRAGTLTQSPPPHPQPSTPDTFVHDPWRPVPALGGHAAFPAGSFDRSNIDCRSDVVTYTSAPLETDLHLAGATTIELYCTADTASFDVCAILSEVKPDGSVFNFSQGYLYIHQPVGKVEMPAAASQSPSQSPMPAPQPLTPHLLTLQPTCICIPQGSAIRLSLSGACFPAYAVNAGTGDRSGQGRLMDARVITVTIYSDGDRASQLQLPVIP
ncbi:CocE/NonD family hydrolase [Thermocoleostomius sinensis]|uniref:CocE/NonD family hydrolase n=1 Tax=Thermocoleostomius sinensis A174 TaxID=2016057 RepID=A0A9E8ZDC2_9CYAN|nr:CocE/NonD family hydrolase [Thermocoleostomius sinensis]WAL60741.1 CocE/NonD family hydrolase [Thermocoleostomius sinensis A174]